MTALDIKKIVNGLINAINEYKNDKDYDEIELEQIIDELLCRLPRDVVFMEWFDRSDIKNIADGVFDDPVDEDTLDKCMKELDNFGGNIMDNDIVDNVVADTVRTIKGANDGI